MLPISVCIIARNEENSIGECLRRLSRYDWEIIIADTGSDDRTMEIARSYTPHVYHFDWVNDFSAARNYSISKASNDYILIVDCDEYLEKDETTASLIARLPQLISPRQAGMLNLISPSAEPVRAGQGTGTAVPLVHEHVARFFHRKYTRYEGSIHEQLASVDGTPLEFVPIPLTFYHVGYSTPAIKKKKADRNIAMLKAELQTGGANPYLLFQLGQSYFGLSDYEQALPYFEQALSLDVNEKEDYVQTMVESYGYCLLNLKLYAKALELEGIYDIFSKTADFVFLMGLVYMNNAMFQEAVLEFQKAASIPVYAVDGVNSYKAYYNIGVIYECMGNIQKALEYYDKCGAYEPALKRKDAVSTTRP